MSYQRKWAFARAQVWDEGVLWLAESRAGSGTWVIREVDDEDPPSLALVDALVEGEMVEGLTGAYFPFHGDHQGILLYMTPEQREALSMSDAAYAEIEAALRWSMREARVSNAEPTPMLSCLGSRSRDPGILEGVEVEHEHGGIKLRREGDVWIVVGDSADEVDAAARARVSS